MKTVSEILEEVKNVMCSNYCKWPDQWDEEEEEMELFDSYQCKNCPLNRL